MIVRFTCIWMLWIFCSVPGMAQNPGGLTQLISVLESKYAVKVSYDATLEKLLNSENQYFPKSASLEEFLLEVFADGTITYKIVDGNKLLLRKHNIQTEENLITGVIMDGSSDYPLAFASVYIPGTTQGTITDEEGRFKLSVTGYDTLLVQYLGYETGVIECNRFDGRITLNPKPFEIEEVTIYIHPTTIRSAGNDGLILDGNAWINKSASQIFGKDIVRSLQLLPGIMADTDEGGKLHIRGSQSDEVLTLVDGIPLYKLDHYYGIFGSVNPLFIDKIALYKNNQPLEYETRTGGLLVLTSKTNVEKLEADVEVDFMKVNGNVHLPVANGGIVIGGRWNHTDPFESTFSGNADNVDLENSFIDRDELRRIQIENAIPVFDFHDVNAKVYYNLTDRLRFQVSGLSVYDNYNREYSNSFSLFVNRRMALNNESFQESEQWENEGLAVESDYLIGDNNLFKARFYTSRYENRNQVETKLFLRTRNSVLLDKKLLTQNYNQLSTQGLDLVFKKKESIDAGFKFISRNNFLSYQENQKSIVNREDDISEFSAFINYKLDLGENVEATFGGKYNFIDDFNISSFSPSVGIFAKVHNNLIIKGSFTRLYQNLRELQFESRFGLNQQYFVIPDNDIYPQGVAQNYMLGFGWKKSNWGIDLEAYYKKLDGAIGYLPSRPGISSVNVLPEVSALFKVYSGKMYSRGLDFLIYHDHKHWYTQLAYTWSKTENQFKEIYRGSRFPGQFDRRHQLKWLNNFNIGKNFSIGNTFVYTSGRPYLSFDALENAIDRKDIVVEDVIRNLPAYFRMDLSLTYTIPSRTLKPHFTFSVYNLTNHENLKYIQQTYRVRTNEIRGNNFVLGFSSPLVERLYNISVGIRF